MNINKFFFSAGFVALSAVAIQACSSDEEKKTAPTADASTGGSSGSGGGSSAQKCGGVTCPTTDPTGMGIGVPCCTTSNACGFDYSAAQSMMGGMGVDASGFDAAGIDAAALQGCVAAGDGGGLIGPGKTEGILTGPNGEIIDLDPSCGGTDIDATITQVHLNGCCMPDGKCGSSTDTLTTGMAAGLGVPFQCASAAQVQAFVNPEGGTGMPITMTATDLNQGASCTYQGGSAADSGGGGDSGGSQTDASSPADAATGG